MLTEAGEIRADVGATGIAQVKGVAARAAAANASASAEVAYGTLVAPNLVAVDHDHFLSFRLDMDVDGTGNTLVRGRLAPVTFDGENGRHSAWHVVDTEIDTEGAIEPDGHFADEIWKIVNPNLTNGLGQHPGYELRLGHSATSLLTPRRCRPAAGGVLGRAGVGYRLRSYQNELYAAVSYPNQSRGGDGLPAYSARRRPVVNTDIVLWYTMGFHHVPRPEDWPVLPTMWHSVSLVPDGFFDRNPALDAPADVGRGETAK